MSIAWRSFDILFCLCVCAYVFLSRTVCMYWDVHEACKLMDIFVNTECNVIVFSLCSFSLLLFLFFTGCSLLSVFFPLPLPHFPTLSISLSTLSVPFLLCLFICPLPFVFPVLSTLFLSFWVLSFLSLFPSSTPFPRWPWVQETSGLSPAAGCGRHGEDAWARLEVCVHVPAGVLQGSGDEGPG